MATTTADKFSSRIDRHRGERIICWLDVHRLRVCEDIRLSGFDYCISSWGYPCIAFLLFLYGVLTVPIGWHHYRQRDYLNDRQIGNIPIR